MFRKTVLITGASSGIGLASARRLAALGAQVLMVCRDRDRGTSALREVSKLASSNKPLLFTADLLSQAAVCALASEVKAKFRKLDVLINNAAAVFWRRELTADGIERTFAVNHLAPFLLTNRLLSCLRAAPAGRIITVTSEIHSARLDFGNLRGEKSYSFMAAYKQSKLANILFMNELARRLERSGVTANCLSPGLTASNMGLRGGGFPRLMTFVLTHMPSAGSVESGADMPVYLATAPEVGMVSGKFYYRGRAIPSKPVTYDHGIAQRLWEICERLTAQADAPRAVRHEAATA